MSFSSQVTKEHYLARSYDTKDRWASYWHQLERVCGLNPRTVLEIGPGNGTVRDALRKRGISVITVDIAEDLGPDVVASIINLPFGDGEFEVLLAAEVLEHIPFSDVPKALAEIHRVTQRYAVISLPHAGYVFSLEFKIPLFKKISVIYKLPFFWKTHKFNGEHYWEVGKRGYGRGRVKKIIREAGFKILESRIHADDPAHYFLLLEKS